jgi:hypothetical protein
MISVSKDEDGKVIALIEWRQVAQSGFDKLRGEYVFINDLWIHPKFRHDMNIMRHLGLDIMEKSVGANYCYFTRKKYGGRMSKIYTREHFEKLFGLEVCHGF